jgi:positive regulator of sigma E activity
MKLPATTDCLSVRGIVRAVGVAGEVDVELLDAPRCRGCEGACLWRRMPQLTRLSLRGSEALSVGDRVNVSLPAHWVLVGACLLYGLPLTGLLAGALAGSLLGASDIGVLIGALTGVALSFAAAPPLRRRVESAAAAALTLHLAS